MGCWNETCAVTGLAIRHGDPVRMFILSSTGKSLQRSAGGFSYADEVWYPRYLPIAGKYDDYGSIENVVEDFNLELIKTDLRKELITVNSIDRFLSVDDNELTRFLRTIERGEAQTKAGPLGQMFVLEDAYQHMISVGRKNIHFDGYGPYRISSSEGSFYNSILYRMGYKVKLFPWEEVEESPELEQLKKPTEDFGKFAFSMERLRKQFSPQSGKGSQGDDDDFVAGLATKIHEMIQSRNIDID